MPAAGAPRLGEHRFMASDTLPTRLQTVWVCIVLTLATTVGAWEPPQQYNAQWQPLTNAGLSPREYANSAVLPVDASLNRLVAGVAVVGGADSKAYLTDEYVLDAGATQFKLLTNTANVTQRIQSALVYYVDRLYLMGGMVSGHLGSNDVYTSSLAGEWSQTNSADWAPRYGHQAVVFQSKLFVLGGSTSNGLVSDVWSWTGKGKWIATATQAAWPGRMGFAVAVYNGRLWLLGGQGGTDGNSVLSDCWSTPDGASWKQETSLPAGRWGLTAVVMLNRLFAVAGQPPGTDTAHSFWLQEPATSNQQATWQVMDPADMNAGTVSSRQYFVAQVLNNVLLVAAGSTLGSSPSYLGDVWTWDPCSQLNCAASYNGNASCAFPFAQNLTTMCMCRPGFTSVGCNASVVPPSNILPPHGPAWWVVGLLVGIFCALLVVVVVFAIRHRLAAARRNADSELSEDLIIPPHKLKVDPSPIAAGGFAQVYRARYQGSLVAVKQIHAHLVATKDREALYTTRFKAEALMMAKLQHPNIQGLIGVCFEPRLCLVTEFAPFGSLSDVLGDVSCLDQLSAESLLKICHQIAAGMLFLHTRKPKITHRDLNTNNVLVYDLRYESLNVKVSDFGLSKEVSKDTSMTGYLGSPSYIAPEILTDSASYDEKVDVYSFGIIMWVVCHVINVLNVKPRPTVEEHRNMLQPFPGMSAWQIVARVKDGYRPEVPRCELCPVLPALMVKAWAPNPQDRPSFDHILNTIEREDTRLRRPAQFHGNVYREQAAPTSYRPRTITEIGTALFLGGLAGARDREGLHKRHISHVLCVTRQQVSGTSIPRECIQETLDIDDEPEFNILQFFPRAIAFIEQGRRDGAVFVHCLAARSRSVSIVAAYLMVAYDMTADEAIDHIRARHPDTDPNPGFVEQLKQFENPQNPMRVAATQALQSVSQHRPPLPLLIREKSKSKVASPGARRKRIKKTKGTPLLAPDSPVRNTGSGGGAAPSLALGTRIPRRGSAGELTPPTHPNAFLALSSNGADSRPSSGITPRMLCPNCHTSATTTQRFCTRCGSRLPDPDVV